VPVKILEIGQYIEKNLRLTLLLLGHPVYESWLKTSDRRRPASLPRYVELGINKSNLLCSTSPGGAIWLLRQAYIITSSLLESFASSQPCHRPLSASDRLRD